jgi:hypothetical protein
MTETKASVPDFSKVSEENIKNFNRDEQVKEDKKWVRKLIHIFICCLLFNMIGIMSYAHRFI